MERLDTDRDHHQTQSRIPIYMQKIKMEGKVYTSIVFSSTVKLTCGSAHGAYCLGTQMLLVEVLPNEKTDIDHITSSFRVFIFGVEEMIDVGNLN